MIEYGVLFQHGLEVKFGAKACQKTHRYEATLIIEWIVSVFFCAQRHVGFTKRKERLIVSMLETKEEERRVKESVFSHGSSSRELMESLGCSGYIQQFYEFLQGNFIRRISSEGTAPICRKNRHGM